MKIFEMSITLGDIPHEANIELISLSPTVPFRLRDLTLCVAVSGWYPPRILVGKTVEPGLF